MACRFKNFRVSGERLDDLPMQVKLLTDMQSTPACAGRTGSSESGQTQRQQRFGV